METPTLLPSIKVKALPHRGEARIGLHPPNYIDIIAKVKDLPNAKCNGSGIRFIQELLGHKDLKTTMIYTHVATQSIKTIQSPLDQLSLDDNNPWKNPKD